MSQLLPYLYAALALLILFAAVPASLYGLAWLRAKRVAQDSLAAKIAFEAIEGLAATIVAAAATEVADLKDPTKPGRWDAAAAARIFQRAVYDLARVGGKLVADIRALQRLTPQAVEALIEAAVEAQVGKLRALQGAGAARILEPSELARVEGLHDLAATPASLGGPLRGATRPMGFPVASAPHGSSAGEPPRDPSSPTR